MQAYDTMSQAVEALKAKGFTFDFNLLPEGIESKTLNQRFGTDDFEVMEVHRFEGMSSEDDSSVLFALKTGQGQKGLLVDAYGTYSEALSPAMIQKMKTH
jgi:hypothetical protein